MKYIKFWNRCGSSGSSLESQHYICNFSELYTREREREGKEVLNDFYVITNIILGIIRFVIMKKCLVVNADLKGNKWEIGDGWWFCGVYGLGDGLSCIQ